MKICLLVSGNLGYEVLKDVIVSYSISSVMTDKKSVEVVEFCSNRNIPLYIGNPRDGKAIPFIKEHKVDILFSVNYLFLLDKDLLDLVKNAINFHGSLLPKYRGRTPHVWAIINGETKTGITAHIVDEGCDTGSIIEQIEVPISQDDTGADILNKYLKLYPEFVSRIVGKVLNNELNGQEQDHSKATYFSKRTPEDGQINWEWQKERLKNWIRAQAFPYPGAFTYFEDNKVIINKIEFSDAGFTDSMPNGLILLLENNFPIVKTGNGAVKIIEYHIENKSISLKKGFKFYEKH